MGLMIPQKPHNQEVERVSDKSWLLWEKAELGEFTPIREDVPERYFRLLSPVFLRLSGFA